MSTDPRPDVAVGHIRLDVNDVPSEFSFFVKHGMRQILNRDNFAILELRGGTHLILQKSEDRIEAGTRTPFDLMVDDIDAAYSKYASDGLSTTPIERGNIHDSFTVTTPTGYVVPVNSSHVAGPV